MEHETQRVWQRSGKRTGVPKLQRFSRTDQEVLETRRRRLTGRAMTAVSLIDEAVKVTPESAALRTECRLVSGSSAALAMTDLQRLRQRGSYEGRRLAHPFLCAYAMGLLADRVNPACFSRVEGRKVFGTTGQARARISRCRQYANL